MRRILLLFALFAFPLLRGQQLYYVSPTGTDAQGMGSLWQPFQTVQYAISVASPGTTIYVMSGVYHEHLDLVNSGSASQPIVLTNYSGQHAIIDGNQQAQPLLSIHGKSNLKLTGLELRNAAGIGASAIEIDGACSNVEISNCFIHDIAFDASPGAAVVSSSYAWVVRVKGDDASAPANSIRFLHNVIENCRLGHGDAISFSGFLSNFSICKNTIRETTTVDGSLIAVEGFSGVCAVDSLDQPKEGIIAWNSIRQVHQYSGTLYSNGILCDGISDCRIENNCITGLFSGIRLSCKKSGRYAQRDFIRDNTLYLNGLGISVGYGELVTEGTVDHAIIANNTLYANDIFSLPLEEIFIGYCENASVVNNLIYGRNSLLMACDRAPVNLTVDYNLYYCAAAPQFSYDHNTDASLATWQSATGFDAHSLYSDPQLLNTATNDFHLQAESPAIDAGDTAYVAVASEADMDTMSRVQNGRVDIGADEYGTAVGIEEYKNVSGAFTLAQNPDHNSLDVLFSSAYDRNMKVDVFSIDGKLVESAVLPKGSAQLRFNTASYTAGTYIVICGANSLKFVR